MLWALRDYLTRGGYPEVVLKPELAEDLIKAYRETVVYRDVVKRHRLRDVRGFELFPAFVERSFCNIFSITSVHRELKALGHDKSKRPLRTTLNTSKRPSTQSQSPSGEAGRRRCSSRVRCILWVWPTCRRAS